MILMVKQSPFQTDLFDLTYIEEQIKSMKEDAKIPKEEIEKSHINKLLSEQLTVLHHIEDLLSHIEKNTQKKRLFHSKK